MKTSFIKPHRSLVSIPKDYNFLFGLVVICLYFVIPVDAVLATSLNIPNKKFPIFISHFSEETEASELQRYESIAGLKPDNFDYLWRVAYLYLRKGWLSNDSDLKKNHFFKALEYAKKSYQIDPKNYYAILVLGASQAKTAKYAPVNEKVQIARLLKQKAKLLLSIRQDDPDVWYLTAWWNYEIACLPPIKKILASLLYGGLPKGASLNKGISCMQKAISLRPDYCAYQYDLGRFFQKAGEMNMALRYYQRVLQLRPICREDFIYHEKAKKKLLKIESLRVERGQQLPSS